MRRFLTLSLLAVASAGSAVAQSNVTLFGVLDNNIGWGKGSVSSIKRMGSGGFLGSRLGFRGTEDLGGGLRASFVLEHGFNSDDASATPVFWNRQAYVGLGGGFGDVLLGRQYTPTFLVHATYDAFGPQGVAAQQVLLGSIELAQAANIRANDALTYRTPAGLGGFSLLAMVSDHTASPGWYHGIKAGYAAGAVSVDLALGHFNNPAVGDVDSVTVNEVAVAAVTVPSASLLNTTSLLAATGSNPNPEIVMVVALAARLALLADTTGIMVAT